MDEWVIYLIVLIIIVVIIIIIIILDPNKVRTTSFDSTLTCTCIGNKGRLGNQLFQLAAVMGIANRNNINIAFPKSILNTQLGQLLDLSDFKIDNVIPSYLIKKINEDREFYYSNIIIPKNKYSYDIDGYFQSYLYFADIDEKIHNSFKIKQSLIDKMVKKYPSCKFKNSIAIHVRRGDYINEENLKTYTQCNVEYYNNAFETILKKLKNDPYSVIICSEDINWCKTHLKVKNAVYSNNVSWDEDFTLLSLCQHQIMANSTFSWWSAYLKPLGIEHHIVAPTPWFKVDGQFKHMNSTEIYHPNWSVIQVYD